jgi:RND family efflux transporter MFP subunit
MRRLTHLDTVLALALGLASCSRPPAPPPEEATPVKVATVEVSRIRDASEYIATLKSRRSITLQPQIDGQITKIFVASGDAVKAGDPIMQIDPARQEALVSSEQATRAARTASLSYWKGQVERLTALHEGGAVSRQELEQAKTSYDSARADVAALDAQVRQQEVQLRYYRVSAPAGGVIGDVPVRVGDRVTPVTVLTTLSQNQMLEAYISVPVERAGELRRDMPVEILAYRRPGPSGDRGPSGASPSGREEGSAAEGGDAVTTTVSFISPLVNDETQSVLVKAIVGNEKAELRAGQFVRARLLWGEHSAPLLPVIAALRLGGQHFAYVVEADKDDKGGEKKDAPLRARQRAVTLGAISGNGYEVRAGLKAGERVVVSGVQKLRDGSAVRPEGP